MDGEKERGRNETKEDTTKKDYARDVHLISTGDLTRRPDGWSRLYPSRKELSTSFTGPRPEVTRPTQNPGRDSVRDPET